MNFYTKVKWVLGILVVFFLILATNLIDRHNFIRVRDTVVTIYEDRLIAKDLIFEISKVIQEKEVALVSSDTLFFTHRNNEINSDIHGYIIRFENTKLTGRESKIFNDLKNSLNKLEVSEGQFIESRYQGKDVLLKHIYDVKDDLYELSKIQLVEGKRQVSISKQVLDTMELFTQIEIYILVILAILIQIIVIYKPKD